jgi:dTDP-4-dehydrorhamnose 3,5-epimerase
VKVTPTAIPEVLLIEPVVWRDQRGFFLETWHAGRYAEMAIGRPFVQDNHSRSVRGTLRGLHYQIQQPQGKLVHTVVGAVFDVAVDLRRSSPSFRRWIGVELSEANHRQLWVPPGFAHGFYVLSEVADLVYKCTEFYAAEHERTVRWDDPELAIDWPLTDTAPPLLSSKDAAGLALGAAPTFP